MGIRPPESPGPVIQPEIEDTTRRVSGVEISKSPVGPTGLTLSPISPHPGEEIQVIPPSTPPPEERSSSEMSEVEIVARPPKRKLGVVVDKSLMVSSEYSF